METLARGVWQSLHSAYPQARRVSLGRDNRHLAWWVPWMVLRVAVLLVLRRTDRVLCGDALTYALVRPLLRVLGVPGVAIVNGLDVTYSNPLYRAFVLPAVRSAPVVLAISAATAQAVESVGVGRDRIRVLPLGLAVPGVSAPDRVEARARALRRLSLGQDVTLLLTVGRLVPRKGAAWFIAEVLPRLPATVHYALAGEGVDEPRIRAAAEAAGLGSRVHVLGRVDDEVREELLRGADLFVQPNIVVPGDMEGFGLVTIEAALRCTPVVAADLEGIKDAVAHEVTGLLVPSGDADAWVAAITRLTASPAGLVELGRRFGDAAAVRYGESAMAAVLVDAMGAGDGTRQPGAVFRS